MTAEEVAKHVSKKSCHVIIEGMVFDVTEFLSTHPGGEGAILRWSCAARVSRPTFSWGYLLFAAKVTPFHR